jgi:Ran-binding protein 1
MSPWQGLRANCIPDANAFKDAFIKAQKDNEALFKKAEEEAGAEKKEEEAA